MDRRKERSIFFISTPGNSHSDKKCQFKGHSQQMTVDIYLLSFKIPMGGPKIAENLFRFATHSDIIEWDVETEGKL